MEGEMTEWDLGNGTAVPASNSTDSSYEIDDIFLQDDAAAAAGDDGGNAYAYADWRHGLRGYLSANRGIGVGLLVAGCLCVVAFCVILSLVNWLSRRHGRAQARRHPEISRKKVAPLPPAAPPPQSPTNAEIWGAPLSPGGYSSAGSGSEDGESSASNESFEEEGEDVVLREA